MIHRDDHNSCSCQNENHLCTSSLVFYIFVRVTQYCVLCVCERG